MSAAAIIRNFKNLFDVTWGTPSNGAVPTWNATSAKLEMLVPTSNHTHAAADIVSGTFLVARGGTGLSAYAAGDLLYASDSNTLSALAGNGTATTKALTMTAGVPTWTDFAAANLNDAVTLPFLANDNIFTGQNTFAAGTITASKPLTITQTWNSVGVDFIAQQISVTATAKGGSSKIVDWAVDGSSKFIFYYNGNATYSGSLNLGGTLLKSSSASTLNIQAQNSSTANLIQTSFAAATFTQSSGTMTCVGITPTYNQTGTAGSTDLLINRTETAVGSGSHYLIDAQVGGVSKFNVSNAGTINSGGITSSATVRAQVFSSAGTNSQLTVHNQNMSSVATALILCNGAYSASTAISQTAVAISPTINQSGSALGYTALKIAATETAVLGTNRLIDCYAGAAGTTNVFYVDNAGTLQANDIRTASGYQFKSAGDAYLTAATSKAVYIRANNSKTVAIFNVGNPTLLLQDTTASTGVTTLAVKSGAGQSTTNLQEWQNNSGTVLSYFGSGGTLGITTDSTSMILKSVTDGTASQWNVKTGTDTNFAGYYKVWQSNGGGSENTFCLGLAQTSGSSASWVAMTTGLNVYNRSTAGTNHMDLQTQNSSTNNSYAIRAASGTFTTTSGTAGSIRVTPTFAPTSGTSDFRILELGYIVNQTGGANGAVTGLRIGATETAVGGTHRLIDCYSGAAGTTNVAWIDNVGNMRLGASGVILKPGTNNLDVKNSADNAYASLKASTYYLGNGADGQWSSTVLRLPSGSQYAWASTSNATGASDTGLARSAAGVVKVTDGSTGYGHLSCNFIKTEGLNAGGTVSSGPDGVLQIQDNAGNTRYIPYYNTATLA